MLRFNKIHSAHYNDVKSLQTYVSELSNPKVVITDADIVNIVVKYMVSFIFPDMYDQRTSLQLVNKIIELGDEAFRVSKIKGGDSIKIEHEVEKKIVDTFLTYSYGLSMIGDICSTCAIFKDIVIRKLDPEKFNNHYLGMDLGTGTGILLLAQYISAKRNGFSSIDNIGVDIDSSTLGRLNELLKRIPFGRTLVQDTTDKELYTILDLKYPISSISNETITKPSVSMDAPNDPFYNNLTNLCRSVDHSLLENTEFFPSKISVQIRLGENIFNVLGDKNNYYNISQMQKSEKDLKSSYTELGDERSIFSHVYPVGIELNNTIVPLENVGDEYEKSGLVIPTKNLRYRWKKG